MRISDWSSDVCSSDLVDKAPLPHRWEILFDKQLSLAGVVAFIEHLGHRQCWQSGQSRTFAMNRLGQFQCFFKKLSCKACLALRHQCRCDRCLERDRREPGAGTSQCLTRLRLYFPHVMEVIEFAARRHELRKQRATQIRSDEHTS